MKIDGSGCAKGCSIGCLSVILIFVLLILTMCHVPKSKYKPYVTAGNDYYETVLGVRPKITHDFMIADESGGFGIDVEFTEKQKEEPLVQLYLNNTEEDSSYSFRGTSTKPNIVGLSELETKLLERSNAYSKFNLPLSKMLDDLLDDNMNGSEIGKMTNGGSFSIYSTNLSFWSNVLKNYEQLKSKTFNERIEWLNKQTNNETYYYIIRYVSLEEMSTGTLAKIVSGNEEEVKEILIKQIFPSEIIKNFPVGSIYELRTETQQSRILYESNEKNELVDSRYEYPVTY